jgi:hypothetical protein
MRGRVRGWTMCRSPDMSEGQGAELIRNGGMKDPNPTAAAAGPPTSRWKSWPPKRAAAAGNGLSAVDRRPAGTGPGFVAVAETALRHHEPTRSQWF